MLLRNPVNSYSQVGNHDAWSVIAQLKTAEKEDHERLRFRSYERYDNSDLKTL